MRLFKNGEIVSSSVGRAGEVGVEGNQSEAAARDLIDQNLLRKKVPLHVIARFQSEHCGTVQHSEAGT